MNEWRKEERKEGNGTKESFYVNEATACGWAFFRVCACLPLPWECMTTSCGYFIFAQAHTHTGTHIYTVI